MPVKRKKIIVAITGASGTIYGIKLLKVLRDLEIETHLIISKPAHLTIATESPLTINDIRELADNVHNFADVGACIASGSFRTNGMIIAPCSMNTLASIANGLEDNLITRTAAVIIKEQKKLALMVRETPLSPIHLQNMLTLAKIGVAIFPPVPAFYTKPETIDDIVTHSVLRLLDLFDIEQDGCKRWQGMT